MAPEPLQEYDWTPAQIMGAISLAIRAEDLKAAIGLLHMLAVKDPHQAEILYDALKAVLAP